MPLLTQGQIIRAEVRDQRGRNPKIRPLVIITSTPELQSSDPFYAVAITGRFEDPPAEDEVLLPWHRNGLAKTRLRKPCVAKCSWICEIRKDGVVEVKGFVPRECMEEIMRHICAR